MSSLVPPCRVNANVFLYSSQKGFLLKIWLNKPSWDNPDDIIYFLFLSNSRNNLPLEASHHTNVFTAWVVLLMTHKPTYFPPKIIRLSLKCLLHILLYTFCHLLQTAPRQADSLRFICTDIHLSFLLSLWLNQAEFYLWCRSIEKTGIEFMNIVMLENLRDGCHSTWHFNSGETTLYSKAGLH